MRVAVQRAVAPGPVGMLPLMRASEQLLCRAFQLGVACVEKEGCALFALLSASGAVIYWQLTLLVEGKRTSVASCAAFRD